MSTNVFQRMKHWLAPRSLRYQLLSRALFILSALLVLIGIFQYVFMSGFIYRNMADNIRSQVMSVPLQVWQMATQSQNDSTGNRPQPLLMTLPGSSVAFIDNNGSFHDLTGSFSDRAAVQLPRTDYQAALTYPTGHPHYQFVMDSGKKQLVVLVAVGPPDHTFGLVQVATDVGPLRRVVIRQLTIFIVIASAAMIAGLLLFISTLRKTLIPLSKMVSSVRQVDAGNLQTRLDLQGTQTEIAQLSTSFNAMLGRLELSFESERLANEKMRNFVADASHELRTPLTSIRGFLEVLQRGAATNPEQLSVALESMQVEAERLTKLVSDLLQLARIDRDQQPELHVGQLDQVVSEMTPQLRVLAGSRHVDIQVQSNISARFDRDQMKQVILNLFENAVSHTDPMSGQIGLSLKQVAGAVVLEISDNGLGIAKEHQPYVFERFYRMDSARSRKSGGAGLGLAISKSIVQAHGGEISCTSELGHGAVFTVIIPTIE